MHRRTIPVSIVLVKSMTAHKPRFLTLRWLYGTINSKTDLRAMINAHSKPPSIAFRLGVLVLLLATWALLLFRLNDVPPGFQHDQMFNSLDALSIGHGRPAFPFYFPANFGREALGIYPVALIFKLAGGHFVWSLRFTSVLWGMLALSLTVGLALRTMPRAAALIAGGLLAGSFWFIFTTRLGLSLIHISEPTRPY